MKKITLMDNVDHLSEQARKDLFQIENLLNRSQRNLAEVDDDLTAVEKAFAVMNPLVSPSKTLH